MFYQRSDRFGLFCVSPRRFAAGPSHPTSPRRRRRASAPTTSRPDPAVSFEFSEFGRNPVQHQSKYSQATGGLIFSYFFRPSFFCNLLVTAEIRFSINQNIPTRWEGSFFIFFRSRFFLQFTSHGKIRNLVCLSPLTVGQGIRFEA